MVQRRQGFNRPSTKITTFLSLAALVSTGQTVAAREDAAVDGFVRAPSEFALTNRREHFVCHRFELAGQRRVVARWRWLPAVEMRHDVRQNGTRHILT